MGSSFPDAIIHSRITNDERPLRRVVKKFHNYTAATLDPINPLSHSSGGHNTVVELREAFLVELASFQLSLKKSAMICEAEARQVEEYNRERRRIGWALFMLFMSTSIKPFDMAELEHGSLKGQIEQLKTSLEHEQTVRRRKIEYDLVAEKVNTLPSRAELEL
jgi:THO complex subunit 7